jgi:hypothetical protein
VDVNQQMIVEALRAAGATVAHTHMVGSGFPDIVVGKGGNTYLMEIKQPKKRDRLTDDERRFMVDWQGHTCVVTTPEEALIVIGAFEDEP